jgi:hypothetical protein
MFRLSQRRLLYSRDHPASFQAIFCDLSVLLILSTIAILLPSTPTPAGFDFDFDLSTTPPPVTPARSLRNVVIVTTGCQEEAGTYNPPRDRYTVLDLRCDPATNDVDAREAGQILRFFRDYYGKFAQKKLIFCHAHDTSWHVEGKSIWEHIDDLVHTDYFWEGCFGNVMDSWMLGVSFERVGNEVRCQMDGDTWWMNMTDFASYLFEGTSFMSIPWTHWNTPCCSTFFMDSDLIMLHPREEYRILLERVRIMTRLGYCRMFNRRSCIDNALVIEESPRHWNFVVGGVLERMWAPMFMDITKLEWNLTTT